MPQDTVLNAVIIGYRRNIQNRYQYDNLKKTYSLPETITEDTVNAIKAYFLEYVYPTVEKRKELNDAFEALDTFIKHPSKLLGILKQSLKLIFNYGKSFPKILSAGIKALKSFRTATKFENNLVQAALDNTETPPYSDTQVNNLILQLSREDIDEFIDSSQTLFEIIHDETLVKNIKDVLSFLIDLMKAKPKIYASEDIKAIEIGLEMITQAEVLFTKLNKEDQKVLIGFITKIERDNVDRLFIKE
jgi:hypothetical protein